MAQDKDKKDEKPDDKKTEAPPAKAKLKLPFGPILAVLVILGMGAGIGFWLGSLVKPPAKPPPAEGATAQGSTGNGGHGAEADPHAQEGKATGKSLLQRTEEFNLGEIRSNIRGQQGRRLIKMQVCLYVIPELVKRITLSSAQGADTPGDNIRRLVNSRLGENLKTYDLDELSGPNLNKILEKSFAEICERELRNLFPDLKTDRMLIERVVIVDPLVQ